MKQYYDRYWENIPAELADFHVKWPVLSTFIPFDKNCKILDYGCGKGKILSEIYKINPPAELYGADISKIALQSASKVVPKAKILWIDNDQKVPLASNSLDLIVSLDVIEHIYDTEKVFQEFHRLVRRDGHLLVSTPYYGLIKNIIIALVGFGTVYDPISPHIRFYTKKSLIQMLHEHGFSITKFGYYGRFLFVWRGMYAYCTKID